MVEGRPPAKRMTALGKGARPGAREGAASASAARPRPRSAARCAGSATVAAASARTRGRGARRGRRPRGRATAPPTPEKRSPTAGLRSAGPDRSARAASRCAPASGCPQGGRGSRVGGTHRGAAFGAAATERRRRLRVGVSPARARLPAPPPRCRRDGSPAWTRRSGGSDGGGWGRGPAPSKRLPKFATLACFRFVGRAMPARRACAMEE